ncbi:MAG TPA: beta-ketoacyl synthase N-terminal-like domain-containing protein, partial [Solirubrobacterales bacterium]
MGAYRGALSGVRPDDLAARVISEAVERNGIDPELITDVYMGAANQAGEDNRDVARMASLLAGLPHSVPGATVNRLCASGLEAVNQAARAVRLGEGDVYLAGGVESMSRAPWVVSKPERGLPRGEQTMHDTTLGWRLVNPRMNELGVSTETMGETAENVAERYGVSRPEQDAFALRSHQRAVAAVEDGRFAEEIVPVEAPEGKGLRTVDADEGPRPDASLERLAGLR